MDIIHFNDEILTLINNISISIGIVEFMDYFPLLKQGKANIKTVHYIIKSYVILGNNISINLSNIYDRSIDLNNIYDILNNNDPYDDYLKFSINKNSDLLTKYEEECLLAYELLDIICICKNIDHHPRTGSGWLRVAFIAKNMHKNLPELPLFMLYMCISSGSNLINKISNNNYVKLTRDIYRNYARKLNNNSCIKENRISEIKELIQIDIGDLDPRCANNTLYKFAKLVNETETCNIIKEISIERNLIEKQMLINNFEDLIGPSDIPNNIFRNIMKFI